MSDTPAAFERSAPTFGRDNEQVLHEFLGYSVERVAALKSCGVLT